MKMDIKLRTETPADYRQTENLTREAFWNRYSPGCCEHYLLHVMRNSSAFVPELDLVAECEGRIVGNAVCMRAVVEADDGAHYEVLTLGPLAVLPEYQLKGIGSRMIEHVRMLAREMGFRAIMLTGDPDYYLYQGFIPAEMVGIRTADNMYATTLHVCELYEGALEGIRGRYVENAVYEVEQSAVEAFDRDFAAKERISGTPSQKRFEELVILRRSAE